MTLRILKLTCRALSLNATSVCVDYGFAVSLRCHSAWRNEDLKQKAFTRGLFTMGWWAKGADESSVTLTAREGEMDGPYILYPIASFSEFTLSLLLLTLTEEIVMTETSAGTRI
jgi:hypothetical protein